VATYTVDSGKTQAKQWLMLFDVAGAWDIRAVVYRNPADPNSIIAESGWTESFVTVTGGQQQE